MEHWNRAYREAPEIFDAFTSAEDPDGLVIQRLLSAGFDGRSVLEIGCGTGRYTWELAPHSDSYLALERSPRMLALAVERFRDVEVRPSFICARAESVPLRAASVDHVVAAWVVINLPPASRAAALVEIDRVLGKGRGGLWLIENHWSGEFQELRGRRGEAERARVVQLCDSEGFERVDVVETELRFATTAEAERILGNLCGEAVRRKLRQRPTARLSHNVIILHRPAKG